jgi:hypothetical protein
MGGIGKRIVVPDRLWAKKEKKKLRPYPKNN